VVVDVEDLPRAATAAAVRGCYRVDPDDFEVDEVLGFAPAKSGEHLYLQVEKRGANTHWVATRLARHFGVAPGDVGYAGRKDRHAVARQWFSVRLPGGLAAEAPVALPADPGFALLYWDWHDRKLRPGDHVGNRFRLRVRRLAGELDALDQQIEALRQQSVWHVPNYFGPQRFGRDGGNIARAHDWLVKRGRSPRSRAERGLLMSAARAFLFNEVLAVRVAAGSWLTPVDGDHVADGLPTGPLWGRGRSAAREQAARLEQAALEPHRAWLDGLEHCGLRQDRRSLAVTVAEFELERTASELRLAFQLPAGSFATSVLHELGRFDDVRTAGVMSG
jgi:tRNA pseudouridine13 synthase